MKKIFIPLLSLGILTLVLHSCDQPADPEAISPEWYRGSAVVTPEGTVDLAAIDPDKIDFLYLVSTEVIAARSEADSSILYRSTLCDADRAGIDGELAYVQRYFCDEGTAFNYLAPYYHQMTFEALVLPDAECQPVYEAVKAEAIGIIDYYLKHINQGRPFALVGFSQGAMLLTDVLKHYRPEQLQHMVGTYLLGYGLNAADIQSPSITPATGESGFGHTISFNSVMTPEATWPMVYHDAVTAINPVNWRTDGQEATHVFIDDTLTVRLDTDLHELIVTVPDKTPYIEWMRSNPAYQLAGVHPECLHRWDLLFYAQRIRDNILYRAANH